MIVRDIASAYAEEFAVQHVGEFDTNLLTRYWNESNFDKSERLEIESALNSHGEPRLGIRTLRSPQALAVGLDILYFLSETKTDIQHNPIVFELLLAELSQEFREVISPNDSDTNGLKKDILLQISAFEESMPVLFGVFAALAKPELYRPDNRVTSVLLSNNEMIEVAFENATDDAKLNYKACVMIPQLLSIFISNLKGILGCETLFLPPLESRESKDLFLPKEIASVRSTVLAYKTELTNTDGLLLFEVLPNEDTQPHRWYLALANEGILNLNF